MLTTRLRYQAKLAKRPLLTQVVTTAVLFGTGDVVAQQAVDKKGLKKHDLARTGRMVLYGGGESLNLFLERQKGQPAWVTTSPQLSSRASHQLSHHPKNTPAQHALSPQRDPSTDPQQPSSAQPRRRGTSSWPTR